MGVPVLHYGTCEGGPWNGKQMAHATDIFRVAVDKHTKKAVPAVQTGLEYEAGRYRFEDGRWRWEA